MIKTNTSRWYAKCYVCGKLEHIEAANVLACVLDKFAQRWRKIDNGACGVYTTMICPDCARKGHAE